MGWLKCVAEKMELPVLGAHTRHGDSPEALREFHAGLASMMLFAASGWQTVTLSGGRLSVAEWANAFTPKRILYNACGGGLVFIGLFLARRVAEGLFAAAGAPNALRAAAVPSDELSAEALAHGSDLKRIRSTTTRATSRHF